MKPVQPIITLQLFPPLSGELLAVLKALRPEDWARPTPCSAWTVKDVAAHLLGGNLGRLWKREETILRTSNHVPGYDELVDLINRNNELWVEAARRISPEILIELLELTDQRLYRHFSSLDPDKPAAVTVAWAGNESSPNWFDIAREYTEKWLHQQHIRQEVGVPLLVDRKWLYPVLDTFLRGLPHAYRGVETDNGTRISVQITGEACGGWTLVRENEQWHLLNEFDPHAASLVQIDQDMAWRLFTKGISPEDARRHVKIRGDQVLGEKILEMVSIMA